MRKQKLNIIIAIVIISQLMFNSSLIAAENPVTLKICATNVTSTTTDKLLYNAFRRLGYDCTITVLSEESAAVAVDIGQAHVLEAQPRSVASQYPNLVIVPESVGYSSFVAYTKDDSPLQIDSWQDLAGLKVGHEYQNSYIESQLQDISVDIFRANIKPELWAALENSVIDVAIMSVLEYDIIPVPEGLKEQGTIDKIELFTMLNKKYAFLVDGLSKELKELRESGTADNLHNESSSTNQHKSFLYISSYTDALRSNDTLGNELVKNISQNPNHILRSVSLNISEGSGDAERRKLAADMLRIDFMSNTPDVILISDDFAIDFMREYYYTLFRGIPVVYCGYISSQKPLPAGFEEYFVNIKEPYLMGKLFDQMFELYPDTENIYFISENSASGNICRQKFQENISFFNENNINIMYNPPDIPLSSLLMQISQLPKNTLVILGTYSRDNTDSFFHQPTLQKQICDASSAPVFAVLSQAMGNGPIGGVFTNLEDEARLAANAAIELANGKSPLDFHLGSQEEVAYEYIYDKKSMDKWNARIQDIPKNAIVLNTGFSLKTENPTLYYFACAFMTIIGFAFIGLVYISTIVARKNKQLTEAQKSLHTVEEILIRDSEIKNVKERLESIIHSSPIALIITNEKGIIIEFNHYAQSIMGSVAGDSFFEYFCDENEKDYIAAQFSNKEPVRGNISKIRLPNGKSNRFQINFVTVRFKDETSKIIWCSDIESSEQQKDFFERAQTDLQKITDLLPLPMFILDPVAVTLIYGNNKFINTFGLKKMGATGYNLFNIVPTNQPSGENTFEVVTNFLQTVVQSNVSKEIELTHMLPTQDEMPAKAIATNITYHGKKSVIILLMDMSAEKNRARSLQTLAEREKEANNLKSSFLVNMSHEIRTPMNAIIGLSELELLKPHSKETYNVLKKIDMSAKILMTIINDILDFSKMEAKKLDIINEVFELEDALNNALVVSAQRIASKPIEMLMNIDYNLPDLLIGDKTRIWQILKNILDNSSKYTEKGLIMLEILPGEKDGVKQEIIFKISDTGLGMTKDQLKKLYTPFGQFHEKTVKTPGTGLGMPITKQLTSLMNGTIRVESEINMGTVTTVTIPLEIPKEAVRIKDKLDHAGFKGKRVLIIDNDPAVCGVLSELFSTVGIKPTISHSGDEAVKKISTYMANKINFDVIIIDYLLKEETGIDVVNRLKSFDLQNKILLMVSAYAKSLLPVQLRISGIFDVLEKPFVPSSIMNKLGEVLNLKTELTQAKSYGQFIGARVLLCEDNEINQEVAAGVLGLFGIEPVIAANGQEGLAFLEENEFDLVLMDILMPELDGHQATIMIRNSSKPYKNVPIVAMTANAMKEEVEKCRNEGMNGHVPKPLETDKLYAQLARLMPHKLVQYASKERANNHISYDKPTSGEKEVLEIKGVDIASGLSRFAGKMSIYLNALERFAKEEEVFPAFEDAIMPERLKNSIMQAHTLKGIAGNLSISDVFSTASSWESSLRTATPDSTLYRNMIVSVERARNDISTALKK